MDYLTAEQWSYLLSRHTLRRWAIALPAVALLVVSSIFLVDKPIARFMAGFGVYQTLSTNQTVAQPWMIIAAALAVAIGVGFLVFHRVLPHWLKAALHAGAALLISVFIVEVILKPLFGRAMPTEFLGTGHDRFFWPPADNIGYSFPSGHADQAAAIISVLWVNYSAWRWLYVTAALVLAILLMLGEWHYLSDIIAGGFIGWSFGLAVMATWRRAARSTIR